VETERQNPEGSSFFARQTLCAFRSRNFRTYFAAQLASSIGTWMQITVENWLVLQISQSGMAIAVTNLLQFSPSVLIGMYGGVIADRHDRRRILMVTQGSLGLLALVVGLLAAFGTVRVWIIWIAAGGFGFIKCFDLPALQAFTKDLVGEEDLSNAVAWTGVIAALGRTIGPALGGLLLTTMGVAPGFLFNAVTFSIIVMVLASLRRDELAQRAFAPRMQHQVRAGLTYVCAAPTLAATSVVMLAVFISSYNFQVSIALIASTVLHGDSRIYGWLMSALGLGAASGSLMFARWQRVGLLMVIILAIALAATQVGLAAMHSLTLLAAGTFAYGMCVGLFSATVVSTLQLFASDDMRGRVMALYSTCFLGSALIGVPGFAALAEGLGVSSALRAAALICVGGAVASAIIWRPHLQSPLRHPIS